MARQGSRARRRTPQGESVAIEMASQTSAKNALKQLVHVIKKDVVCETDSRGFAMPGDRSPTEIVVDASEGFIPLWAQGVSLRWRLNEASLALFQDPDEMDERVTALLGDALILWGDAVPIKFVREYDNHDFEIVVRSSDNCSPSGCVLASAFFPDAGRNQLVIYPRMFDETYEEQVETMAHELGHIFGLRHFFAQITETAWRSEIFGKHQPFSIMNYGSKSEMTDYDRADLKRLYSLVWSGSLTEINGTPVRLMYPYSMQNFLSFAGIQNVNGKIAAKSEPCCCCHCGSKLLQ